MTTFFISSNPENLASALKGRTATVEAEFGDTVVEGTDLTLAHHGPRSGNPAPCLAENGVVDGIETVGLSHVDLDSLGGCMAILGIKPVDPEFWELAAFIDVHGAHKLLEANAPEMAVRALHAWWAWSQAHRQFAPRDGSVADVTDWVKDASEAVTRILEGSSELLAKGDAFRAQAETLNSESFVECRGSIVVRVAPVFVNHLYTAPDGTIGEAVVSLNTVTGAITLSFADTPRGTGAREVVQRLWGPEAGGHAGIAGSPRGRRMTLSDLMSLIEAV